MVDGGLRSNNSLLGNDGLESSLEELVEGQSKDVIELSLVFLDQAKSHHSADEGVAFYNIK